MPIWWLYLDTASSFWRRFLDLRTSPEDNSQRMLNALEPGTMVPIHRHMGSTEVVVLLRGRAIQYYYNDKGEVIDQILLEAGGSGSMMSVEVGQWHRLESLESGCRHPNYWCQETGQHEGAILHNFD